MGPVLCDWATRAELFHVMGIDFVAPLYNPGSVLELVNNICDFYAIFTQVCVTERGVSCTQTMP